MLRVSVRHEVTLTKILVSSLVTEITRVHFKCQSTDSQATLKAEVNKNHISPLLHRLHWLEVADRITFRLVVLTYHCPDSLSTRVPVKTTAASFWCSHMSVTSLFVFHCFGYVADLSSHYRWRRFLCCWDLSLEWLARSCPFFNISGDVQKGTEDGTVHAILYWLTQ